MKTYKILRTNTGIWIEFGLNAIAYMGIAVLCALLAIKEDSIFMVVVIFYSIRHVFYNLIDFLFRKTFVETEDGLCLKMSLFTFRLDVANCYTAIESRLPLKGLNQHYTLILTRNDRKRMNRLFKNKIKLYAEDGFIDLEGVAGKISDMFGIHYRGIDKSFDAQGYSDDKGDLLRYNKGYIP